MTSWQEKAHNRIEVISDDASKHASEMIEKRQLVESLLRVYSDASYELHGDRPTTIAGLPIAHYRHPRRLPQILDAFKRLFATARRLQREFSEELKLRMLDFDFDLI